MSDLVTDTHALIWYLENSSRLGAEASQAFDACDRGELTIYIPTICLVEVLYLQEKGRIPADLGSLLETELKAGSSGLAVYDLGIEVVAAIAQIPRKDVPEMPDRIIAATALHLGLALISRDTRIQLSNVRTIW